MQDGFFGVVEMVCMRWSKAGFAFCFLSTILLVNVDLGVAIGGAKAGVPGG